MNHTQAHKIYDCFMFYNEVEILKLRIEILKDLVDYFVIIESKYTHSGMSRDLVLLKYLDEFQALSQNKIRYLIMQGPVDENSWHNENTQRNQLILGLNDADPNDKIIISDVDEIPNPRAIIKAIRYLNYGSKKGKKEIVNLFLSLHFYSFNLRTLFPIIWYYQAPKVFNYETFELELNSLFYNYSDVMLENINQGTTLTKIRFYQNSKDIYNGGYHLSSFGGHDRIVEKTNSYAHIETKIDQEIATSFYVKLFKGLHFASNRRLYYLEGENSFKIKSLSSYRDNLAFFEGDAQKNRKTNFEIYITMLYFQSIFITFKKKFKELIKKFLKFIF